MRNLKFRGWDGQNMIDQYNLYWRGEEFISGLWNETEEYICQGEYEPIIMQYTGLKDRDGVEIFEGDIVEKEIWNPKDGHVIRRYEVVFSDGNYYLKRKNSEYSFGCKNKIKELVIGNIYENPELLDMDNE